MNRSHALLVPFLLSLGACQTAAPRVSDTTMHPADATHPTESGIEALHIRVNQVGYLPDGLKVAVVCALEARDVDEFDVVDASGARVYGPKPAERAPGFGPCVETYRLDFSDLRREGASLYFHAVFEQSERPLSLKRALDLRRQFERASFVRSRFV